MLFLGSLLLCRFLSSFLYRLLCFATRHCSSPSLPLVTQETSTTHILYHKAFQNAIPCVLRIATPEKSPPSPICAVTCVYKALHGRGDDLGKTWPNGINGEEDDSSSPKPLDASDNALAGRTFGKYRPTGYAISIGTSVSDKTLSANPKRSFAAAIPPRVQAIAPGPVALR